MMTEHPELDEPPRSLTPWIAGGVVLVAAGLLATFVLSQGGSFVEEPPLSRGDEHPAVGKPVETLELAPLTGDAAPLSVNDLAGRVTFINFWGTWCQPCLIEFPHLQELEQHFRSQADFQFVSVSCSDDGDDTRLAEDTADFLKRAQADFPTFQDADVVTRRAVNQIVGGFAYPTSLIIGRDGRIKAVWVGYAPGIEKQMREILDRELAAAARSEGDAPPTHGPNG
jgi:thiol-disulfide isomerase/thioredoxin